MVIKHGNPSSPSGIQILSPLHNTPKTHKLLSLGGWLWAKSYVGNGNSIKLLRNIHRANKKRLKSGTKYQFGVAVPCTTKQALLFDKQNGNNLWKEAIQEEMDKIMSFDTFKILEDGEPLEEDYKKIPLHMCFAVKWDGRHKARLIAGGNHTSPGETNEFAGIISNEAVRIGLLLAALNDLDVMVGDVGNAYLHAFTTEKCTTLGDA